MRNAKGLKRGGLGRPKGRANKATLEAKEFALSIVDDPLYQQSIRGRALNGELAPALEAMLWHYAKGKPKEQVAVEGQVMFAWLTRPRAEDAPGG